MDAINNFGQNSKDMRYTNFMFFNYDGDESQDPISLAFADLDKDPSLMVIPPQLTLLQKLENAEQEAIEEDRLKDAVKIRHFVDENIEDLYEDGEKRERVIAEGITLLDLSDR